MFKCQVMIHLLIESWFRHFDWISHWEFHQVIIINCIWTELWSFVIDFIESFLMFLLLLGNHYFSPEIFGKSTFFHFFNFLILSKKSQKKTKIKKFNKNIDWKDQKIQNLHHIEILMSMPLGGATIFSFFSLTSTFFNRI